MNSSHATQTSRKCNELQALLMMPEKYYTINQLAQSFVVKYRAVIPWMVLLSSWLCRHMLAMLAFPLQMLRHLQQFASSQNFCPLLWKSPPTLKQETWWRKILTPTGRKLACLNILLDMVSIHHLKWHKLGAPYLLRIGDLDLCIVSLTARMLSSVCVGTIASRRVSIQGQNWFSYSWLQ